MGRVIGEALSRRPDVHAVSIDLAEGLTTADRAVRRLMCWGGTAATDRFAALTLGRWRRELHTGLLAERRIRAAERRHGPADVLHLHTQATAFAARARMRRTPAIVSLDITQRLASHEVPAGMLRWQYAACAARDREVFRAAAAIVATSRWAANDLADAHPECADRLHVMPYPVPRDGFADEWIEARWGRAQRGEPVRALFIGGDFPRKGGWDLLEAWRSADFGAPAELHVATDWPIAARLVPRSVTLHRGVRAYTPAWLALWSAADLFVMPTTGEAFGVVFQEAAAAGLPAIGTNLNAVPEIVVDGETGVLVPPRDPGALAGALRQLVADPGTRRRMGTAARARATRLYDAAAYGARLAELMDRVVTSRLPSPT